MFSEESNTHYRISSVEDIDHDLIVDLINHHKNEQRTRLETLERYYKGENVEILDKVRRKEEHLADNRAVHNFAKYVTNFIVGYMVGVPLKTNYEEDEAVDELLRDINVKNDADEHNSELVMNLSIYGRAYELLYRSSDDVTKFVTLNPKHTFVIYDDSIEMEPIAAIRYIGNQFSEEETIYLYTDSEVLVYSLDRGGKLRLKEEYSHYFDGIPVNEYANNKYRQGDFEDVISLIDLYDAAQSDTANYMQDLNDAMLKIVGNLDISIEEAKAMKEANLLFLQTEPNANGTAQNADADYIYKKYDVQGAEAYKDRIFNNILLFTSIPNLLDEEGGTNQSGEALKMKLFALSQKRAVKERLFKKSLRDRYRLIKNIMNTASEGDFDIDNISITFTENLPSMVDKEVAWFTQAGGRLSQQTLLEQLSFIENSRVELERIEEENELQQDVFNFNEIFQQQEEVDG